MKAYLVLSDGTVYEGNSLGAVGLTTGEVVFNTGMTGYQEVLTDPSYAGQIVLLTYPLVGNYGINDDDFESDSVKPTGFIVREACDKPSNWRSRTSLHDYFVKTGLVAIQGVDTRAITRHIRSLGVTMGAITSESPDKALEHLRQVASYDETDFVQSVTTAQPYAWGRSGKEAIDDDDGSFRYRLAVLDCGLKFNILRRFAAVGCRSIVYPAHTPASTILSSDPDGVLLSPGPGDPARLGPVVETVKDLLGKRPLFGICLGNQMLCQAIGGKTYKLKFGHRGANHPVKDFATGTVTITSQNHGYAVDPGTLHGTGAEVAQINVNDGTVEGIRVKDLCASSIQYHPEAAPGPWDSRPYFVDFVAQMEAFKR